MTEAEIRDAIKETFRSAEQIWPTASPFKPASVWSAYSDTEEEAIYLFGIIGNQSRPVTRKDPAHDRLVTLLKAILPYEGVQLFTQGYDDETIYVTPPPTIWTPTAWYCTMATDQRDRDQNNRPQKFTILSGTCGSPA